MPMELIPIDQSRRPVVTPAMEEACAGKFKFTVPMGGGNGETSEPITVPWATCQEIYMAMGAVALSAVEDVNEGEAALQRKDYWQAQKIFEIAAAKGDGKAAYALGRMYEKGIGVNKNYYEAIDWYRAAAAQGDLRAQGALGYIYETGDILMARDYPEAVAWYRKGAEQGHAFSQVHLAYIYLNGAPGLVQDYKEAFSLLTKAAEQGYEYGQLSLGQMYADGKAVPQHLVQAHKWVNLAATGGLEKACKVRDKIEAMMTPSQIEEAQQQARDWLASKS